MTEFTRFLDSVCASNVPDWRSADNYPNPKGTTATQWAWEFLRRNPSYREEFRAALIADHDMLALGARWGLVFGAVDPSGHTPSVNVYVDSLVGPGERLKIVPPVVFERSTVMSLTPLHPDFPDSLQPITWKPEHHNQIAIVFDLDRPIKPQLDHASDILNQRRTFPTIKQIEKTRGKKFSTIERQLVSSLRQRHRRRGAKKLPRLRVDKFPTYLRLLDAEAAGATINEMADLLIPPRSDPRRTAAEWLANARQLRDGGYRGIAAASND